MNYSKFTDDIAKQTFVETKHWDVKDWENFRKTYYKDYFSERDSIIVSINQKDKYGYANLYSFNARKLDNIKSYNKRR